MASIQRNGNKYRVQVYVDGVRDSTTKATRQEAAQWALEREAELRGTKLPDKTFDDALKRYEAEVAPARAGSRWELIRVKSLRREPIAKRRLAALGPDDFATWRDERLAKVKPGTVAREMNLLRAVLEIARRDWRWIRDNPMRDVRWPKTPKGRARRISREEVETLARAFGVWDKLQAETATQRIGLAFLLALETAMRSGEILDLTWPNIHLDAQYVHLPKTKNGDSRDVPLSRRACEILRALPLGFGPVFQLDDATRDVLWRRVRDTTAHKDIHFHDSRAEAIWRLSKKLDVLQLARVIGHRDLKSLMIYYNEPASSLARQLG
ncbi:tyrosine-type recombinase/integrase [Xanthomonas arboricola]|uniref:Tyrosine recombinase XerC n=1 Tax=Xanthomonas arboricola TaxID=56448 RepID=A0AAU9ILP6_9XANT|nr:site-specific integrase [Xanthomonas arboricola]CAE6838027.1 Tyrosine recombinase XerC [Xanthomonas arboricola]CAE6838037.1 Tyrosine recombinase XerC [Xanthomonas arboricola]